MKPDWDKLMTEFKDSSTVLIADVDCTADGKSKCDEVGVRGYPTIKYGDPNDLQDYKGGRDFAALKSFAEDLGPTCGPANLDLCDDDKKAKIAEFTALGAGAILCFDKMVEKGIDPGYAAKLIQYGWETITEALKHGGITGMMNRLDNPSKIKCMELADELKEIMRPLYRKHQDDIITGVFSSTMMKDWDEDDKNLLKWRAETAETNFEKTPAGSIEIKEQEYFDNAILMVAMIRAGVELAFEAMVEVGMKPESAYYESLHETPLIANTIARKKLYEMNKVISDTAEYGCYLRRGRGLRLPPTPQIHLWPLLL